MITQKDYTDGKPGIRVILFTITKQKNTSLFRPILTRDGTGTDRNVECACTAFTLGSEALHESDRVRSILSRRIVDQALDIGLQVGCEYEKRSSCVYIKC